MKNNKKAVELSLNMVIVAAILLVVLIVSITVFVRLFGKEASSIEEQIDQLGDEDEDGVVNMFDKCPDDYGYNEFDGCSSQSSLDAAIKK